MGRYVRDKVNHIDIPVYGGGNDTNYKGTKAVWDTLTDAEKDQYDTYDFSDDFNGMTIDEDPTEGSTNPVQSGGVYTALASKVNTSDIANNVTTTASGKVLDARQGKLISDKVSNSSDAYSSSKAYEVGDLCIYNDTLYKCITACSAAAWDVNSSCFEATTLVSALKNNLVLQNVTGQSHTVAAAGYATGTVVVPEKPGYKIVGIVGATAGSLRCFMGNYTYSTLSRTIGYSLCNSHTTSSQTAQPVFSVLYSKL